VVELILQADFIKVMTCREAFFLDDPMMPESMNNDLPPKARNNWQPTAMIGHYVQTQLSRPAQQHRKDEQHS